MMAASALMAFELSSSGIAWLRKCEMSCVGRKNWKHVFVAARDS
jgi:hypothetical protein